MQAQGEHSVLDDSDDDEIQYADDDDSSSSGLSVPDESIDFALVYALHHFPATIEGQANVVKGDSLVLIDDSNSYWWLVRVLKTEQVGYIPAENIETPLERLARLNKHRNVDITSATQAEMQENVDISAARIWETSIPPRQRNAPRIGNTARNPADSRRSLAFSCALDVHRYPPAVWNDEEWLIEREERRAESMHGRDPDEDFDYAEFIFDEDEDHEEGEWDVGHFEAEDRELADELVLISKVDLGARKDEPPEISAALQRTIPPQSDDIPNWERTSSPDVHKPVIIEAPAPRRPPRSAQRLSVEQPLAPLQPAPAPVSAPAPVASANGKNGDIAGREDEHQEAKPTVAPHSPPTKLSPNGGGKLRKEREPPSDDDKEAKKKKGSSVFGIFSRRSVKEKAKNSSLGSESDTSNKTGEGPSSISSSASSAVSAANSTQLPQQKTSGDPPREPRSSHEEATSYFRQREQQEQASYQQKYLTQPKSRDAGSPPTSFLIPPVVVRQRPGSLILTPPITADGKGVLPELSVIRVFAGPGLETEATFKTVLLNSSTTSDELVKQAVQRFRLEDSDSQDYYLSISSILQGTSSVLNGDDRPLAVFEGMVDKVPRVSRNSVGSISSVVSNLSLHPAISKLDMNNDFADDSAVKFFLNRRGVGSDVTLSTGLHISTQLGTDIQREGFASPSLRFALQLVVYANDLPDDMAFDPLTEAILYKSTLKDRRASTTSSSDVSQTVRRKVLMFPKSVTVAEVIELGLEKFGIAEGVVDGGDEVEDKVSRRRSAMLRVRYGLVVDLGNGEEKELAPSSRVVDAFPQPPIYRTAQMQSPYKRRSVDDSVQLATDDVGAQDPTFRLRRATSYRSSTALTSRRSVSMGLDEIALQKLHRDSVASASAPESHDPPTPAETPTRQEIIAAQRQVTRANQQAILSASSSASSLRDMAKSTRSSIVSQPHSPRPVIQRSKSPESVGGSGERSRSITPNASRPQRPTDTVTGPEKPSSPAMRPVLSLEPEKQPLASPKFLSTQRRQLSATSASSTDVSRYATPIAPSEPESPTSPPKAPSPKRLFLPADDFGVTDMLTVIQLRSETIPRRSRGRPVPHPVDDLLFGRPLDLNAMHPKIRNIYGDVPAMMKQVDKFLDDFLLQAVQKR